MTTNLLSRQEGREETKPFFLLFKKIFFCHIVALQCCVYTIQQSESVIHVHISLLFWISFPFVVV